MLSFILWTLLIILAVIAAFLGAVYLGVYAAVLGLCYIVDPRGTSGGRRVQDAYTTKPKHRPF